MCDYTCEERLAKDTSGLCSTWEFGMLPLPIIYCSGRRHGEDMLHPYSCPFPGHHLQRRNRP